MASSRVRSTTRTAAAGAACDGRNAAQVLRAEHQRSIALRLRRAEGQIRGVLRMVESGESCEHVAQQLAAVRNALDRAFFEMMACSLEYEVAEAPDATARGERVAALMRVLSKYA